MLSSIISFTLIPPSLIASTFYISILKLSCLNHSFVSSLITNLDTIPSQIQHHEFIIFVITHSDVYLHIFYSIVEEFLRIETNTGKII